MSDTNGQTYSLRTENVGVYYGKRKAVSDVSINFANRAVTALMGPSGCGKTTLLRALNRIHDVTPDARVEGAVWLGDEDIYNSEIRPIELRRRVGMVFQRPNPFPTLSILGNVTCALPRRTSQEKKMEIAELSLTNAGLWDEVKDRLNKPATSLSGGQQQRLCIARAISVEPEVLLMDEPTSALDPIATAAIEDLMTELTKAYTIIIVTHNMQQAARISDYSAFMLSDETGIGRLIEINATKQIFMKPSDKRTEDYITGRFG